MILKGSQRGGGRQLALHLLNAKENEHVHVHELRGFMAEDLQGAFQEVYAVSRGTKAKQFLFSLSLNPPQNEKVSTETFEAAIERIEKKLKLEDQPRAIVFHEKEGRRHAHAVWSRIDAERMRAVNMDFFKKKLCGLSRELYLEHGWKMPRGLTSWKERDPANYTLHEWQQAKRAGIDPKALKGMFRECWEASDSGKAFAAALKARGYIVARGDRRGFVAVDYKGEVYSIPRYAGQQTQDVRSRLRDVKDLPSVERAKGEHALRISDMLKRHIDATNERHKREAERLAARRKEIIERQRQQRAELQKQQQTRQATETRERAQRFSKGFRGVWDRLTGKHAEVKRQNELETLRAFQRDRAEKDAVIFRQIEQRQFLHREINRAKQAHAQHVQELHRDIARYAEMGAKEQSKLREHFREANPQKERQPIRGFDRDRDREYER